MLIIFVFLSFVERAAHNMNGKHNYKCLTNLPNFSCNHNFYMTGESVANNFPKNSRNNPLWPT